MDGRTDRMWKIMWFGIVRGHSRLLEIAQFDRVHKREFPLAFHSNYVSVLYDIARYLLKIDLNLPHLYLAPSFGDPNVILPRYLATEN